MSQEVSVGNMRSEKRVRSIKRVLWAILVLNIGVALAKYGYGLASNISSMQADGIHSLFDSVGNIVGLLGMYLASRPADFDHPYGHAKFETYASACIGLLLLFAAYQIGSSAIRAFINGASHPDVTPVSFVVMLLTLCVNIIVTTWEHREGRRLGSEVLCADARHTLSDVLVSMSVIIGLVFIHFGFTIVDSIVSLIVAAAILYTAYGVFKQANATLSDKARIPAKDILAIVNEIPGADGCHEVRTRGSEMEVYVDLHLLVDPNMSVSAAHGIAETVEKALKEAYGQIADVIVHVEPDDAVQQEVSRREAESSA